MTTLRFVKDPISSSDGDQRSPAEDPDSPATVFPRIGIHPEHKGSDSDPFRTSRITQILRFIGASLVIGCFGEFLLQPWGHASHLERFFSFLGMTGVVCLSGVLCGLKLREDKGARTFLALALLAIPVNFGHLGGLIYSRFVASEWAPPLRTLGRSYLSWIAPSSGAALTALAIGLPVLGFISWLCIGTLMRERTTSIAVSLLSLHSLILIPSRDPSLIALIMLAAFIGAEVVTGHILRETLVGQTPTGRFTKALLFAPVVLIAGRQIVIYGGSAEHLFQSVLFGMFAWIFARVIPSSVSAAVGALCEWIGVLFTGYACRAAAMFLVTPMGASSIRIENTMEYWYAFSGLVIVSLLMSAPHLQERARTLFFATGLYAALVLPAIGNISFNGLLPSFIGIVASIVTLITGYQLRRRGLFYGSMIALISSFGHHLIEAVQLAMLAPWASIGVLGIIILFASSYLESIGRELAGRVLEFRKEVAKW